MTCYSFISLLIHCLIIVNYYLFISLLIYCLIIVTCYLFITLLIYYLIAVDIHKESISRGGINVSFSNCLLSLISSACLIKWIDIDGHLILHCSLLVYLLRLLVVHRVISRYALSPLYGA